MDTSPYALDFAGTVHSLVALKRSCNLSQILAVYISVEAMQDDLEVVKHRFCEGCLPAWAVAETGVVAEEALDADLASPESVDVAVDL
jgi:hypothetical protein